MVSQGRCRLLVGQSPQALRQSPPSKAGGSRALRSVGQGQGPSDLVAVLNTVIRLSERDPSPELKGHLTHSNPRYSAVCLGRDETGRDAEGPATSYPNGGPGPAGNHAQAFPVELSCP